MKNKELGQLIDDEIGTKPESLVDILEAIGQACHQTAAHLVENWQDNASAKYWERNARIIENARNKVSFPF